MIGCLLIAWGAVNGAFLLVAGLVGCARTRRRTRRRMAELDPAQRAGDYGRPVWP